MDNTYHLRRHIVPPRTHMAEHSVAHAHGLPARLASGVVGCSSGRAEILETGVLNLLKHTHVLLPYAVAENLIRSLMISGLYKLALDTVIQ